MFVTVRGTSSCSDSFIFRLCPGRGIPIERRANSRGQRQTAEHLAVDCPRDAPELIPSNPRVSTARRHQGSRPQRLAPRA